MQWAGLCKLVVFLHLDDVGMCLAQQPNLLMVVNKIGALLTQPAQNMWQSTCNCMHDAPTELNRQLVSKCLMQFGRLGYAAVTSEQLTLGFGPCTRAV